MSKTEVSKTVQAASKRIAGLKGDQVFAGIKTKAVGGDERERCKWLHLALSVDAISGLVLTIDHLEAEDAQTLQAWMEPMAERVGAQSLLTDEADGFKTVADELGW